VVGEGGGSKIILAADQYLSQKEGPGGVKMPSRGEATWVRENNLKEIYRDINAKSQKKPADERSP